MRLVPLSMALASIVSLGCPCAGLACQPDPPRGADPQGGQGKQGPTEAEAAAVRAALLANLKKEGIEIDLAAKTVSIPVVINQPQDPLEYLLIHSQGKAHEALLETKVQPSKLNAALLLIGLRPGKNAEAKPKDPPPSWEDVVEKGVDPVIVIPPDGMKIWMTARFEVTDRKTGEKQTVTRPVEDLVIDMTTGLPLENNDWVFLGGRKARVYRNEPPVYMADYEGNLVSLCYMHPANHLVTNSHERARDEMNWWIAKVCPEPGTDVKLTFHVARPKAFEGRKERLDAMRKELAEKKKGSLEIDRKPSDGPQKRG